jgi:hypothetical protein
MKAIEAVKKLSSLGYRFELAGDRLRYRYEGQGDPDRVMVLPLLGVVKAHKPEVLAFLSKPALPERILTCADCGFHEYQGPNPSHGWGRCTLKKRGCYGLRPACSEIQRQDTDVPLDG